MRKFLRVFRFLLAIEAMRRAWRKFHPIRILKFVSVVFLGVAALALVAVLLKKLSERDEQPRLKSLPAPRPEPKPASKQRPTTEPEPKSAPKPRPEPKPAPAPKQTPMTEPEPTTKPATDNESVPPAEGGTCPASHPVKAVSRSGIYHSTESRWYERSKADICFKDVAAAEAAGFRAPGTTPK